MKIVAKSVFQEKRMKSGLSMKTLSEKANISVRTVFRAEHGIPVYPVVAGKICSALNCSFDDIFLLKDA